MAAAVASVSPSPHKSTSSFSILEDEHESAHAPLPSIQVNQSIGSAPQPSVDGNTVPLVTSRLANSKAMSTSKTLKVEYQSNSPKQSDIYNSSVETLLTKLEEQRLAYEDRKIQPSKASNTTTNSVVTPASTDSCTSTSQNSDAKSADPNIKHGKDMQQISKKMKHNLSKASELPEMRRLKQELDAAKNRIARQEKELSQSRLKSQGPALSQPYAHQAISNMQDAFAAQHSTQLWAVPDDARSDVSDALSAGSFHHRAPYRGAYSASAPGMYGQAMPGANLWSQPPQRPFSNRSMAPNLAPLIVPPQRIRQYPSGPSPLSAGSIQSVQGYGWGRGARSACGTMAMNSATTFGGYSSDELTPLSINSAVHPPIGIFQAPTATYQPRPIGAPLSATAAEFNAHGRGAWESRASSPGETFMSTAEPLNYRRLLDKSVSANWKYIVDKIFQNNDQQASIFLQQKLKVGTVEQKFEIVEAIIAQAYPLMVNRFGNFLVQRCFEHGTPEQVIAIANAIRGNTLNLSMDPFGCHVVQKAFDAVPEEYKAVMVHELLRRIPETVIHRYACHVWQKLFELRWSDSPPQIMKHVNGALCGMWHEVALGETGSLVVQNIFENCLEDDKRPCIEEVLNSIDIVAHGQFGNWCIQHICEHSAPADRNRAIDHVLKYATEYSMDQFASKVVEKCLKIGGPEFLERYLARVCEGRPDRPRIPLIDIASDQYGNYLIQYILTNASIQHRELVASHIRKHMVSLRGSKFGSRVGMLCSNPAYATHPGPGTGVQTQRYASSSTFNNGGGLAIPTAFASLPSFGGPVDRGNARFNGSLH